MTTPATRRRRKAAARSGAILSLLGVAIACTGGSGNIGSSGGQTSGSSSGPTSGSSGSTGSSTATPQAILSVNANQTATCKTLPSMNVGTFGDPAQGTEAHPVKSGESDGVVVTIACRVATSGASGFTVVATIAGGGKSLDLSTDVETTGATKNATLTLRSEGVTWSSAACQLSATDPWMGVASGRYWASFTCPAFTSTSNETCDTFGQIRLENCEPD